MLGASFLATLRTAWEQAVTVVPTRTIRIRLGTSAATLTFAGPGLFDRFAPAFQHLLRADGDPGVPPDELTVCLWDTASSGVHPPRPPWSAGQFQARGEVTHDFGEDLRLSFRIDSGVLSVLDTANRTAYCWVRDPAAMPPWEEAAPLRPILAWWAELTGRQLAHGAAIGTAEGAVLLAARGGSGKSTTALAALEDGMLYLGDDYVMLEPGTPPAAASLYATAKLIPRNLDDRLPKLRALITGRHDVEQDKVTLGLHGTFGDRLVPWLPLRAIVVPSLAPDGRLALTTATGAEALSAIAPTTLFQLPNLGAAALQRMAGLVAGVPCFRLALDRNLATNARALRQLIAREAAR